MIIVRQNVSSDYGRMLQNYGSEVGSVMVYVPHLSSVLCVLCVELLCFSVVSKDYDF